MPTNKRDVSECLPYSCHLWSTQVREKQFEIDWSRVSRKTRFKKLVTMQDIGLKDEAELARKLQEVRMNSNHFQPSFVRQQ